VRGAWIRDPVWRLAPSGRGVTRILEVQSVKVREVIAMLRADGWTLVATRGDHRQFKHPTKPGKVTVPGNLGKDVNEVTLRSVRRQAGLKGGRR